MAAFNNNNNKFGNALITNRYHIVFKKIIKKEKVNYINDVR